MLTSGGSVSNAGTILGGYGGGSYASEGVGAAGGAGMALTGGSITNSGTLQGGAGGPQR